MGALLGIVKLTKSRLANPQAIAIRRDCELDKLCRGSEMMGQLDNALTRLGPLDGSLTARRLDLQALANPVRHAHAGLLGNLIEPVVLRRREADVDVDGGTGIVGIESRSAAATTGRMRRIGHEGSPSAFSHRPGLSDVHALISHDVAPSGTTFLISTNSDAKDIKRERCQTRTCRR